MSIISKQSLLEIGKKKFCEMKLKTKYVNTPPLATQHLGPTTRAIQKCSRNNVASLGPATRAIQKCARNNIIIWDIMLS